MGYQSTVSIWSYVEKGYQLLLNMIKFANLVNNSNQIILQDQPRALYTDGDGEVYPFDHLQLVDFTSVLIQTDKL